jgi:two-component system, chemotaxis family, response regulator Rcp1
VIEGCFLTYFEANVTITSAARLHILLVEDNPGDALLVREALDECGANYWLYVTTDGAEAMEYLQKQGTFQSAWRPDLILLDLNLPKKDGRQVLREIRADRLLSLIPTIVFSTSSAPEDICDLYQIGANSYVTKPATLDAYLELIRDLEKFWGHHSRLPNNCGR